MPEVVVAIIEVKSSITTSTLDQTIDKIAKIKNLHEFPSAIPALVFSFDGRTDLNVTIGSWLSTRTCIQYKEKKVLSPDAIIFFSRSVMLLPYPEQSNQAPSPGKYKKVIGMEQNTNLQGSHLSIMLALVVNACLMKEMRTTHYFSTAQADRLIEHNQIDFSSEKFHMGEGLISG